VPYPEFPVFKIGISNKFIGETLSNLKGSKVATRRSYGNALVSLSKSDAHKQIVALDGDTKNSTFSLLYKNAVPSNFVECFIAEQNLVGWGQGIAQRGKVAFVSTFGAFFARAYDQIRMGGISHNQLKFVGSHSGVSIGEDGSLLSLNY
jgi:transketolase